MCFASSAPSVPQPAPPPNTNTKALASPYGTELAGSLSQLRLGTKANARRGKPAAGTAAPDTSTPAVPPPPPPTYDPAPYTPGDSGADIVRRGGKSNLMI